MPTFDKIESMSPQEINFSCDILFYCLNWFKELINTFSVSKNDEDRRKVVIRLKQMLKLQKQLQKVLSYNLQYTPPLMLHLEDVSGWQPPVSNAGETKTKGKKGTNCVYANKFPMRSATGCSICGT